MTLLCRSMSRITVVTQEAHRPSLVTLVKKPPLSHHLHFAMPAILANRNAWGAGVGWPGGGLNAGSRGRPSPAHVPFAPRRRGGPGVAGRGRRSPAGRAGARARRRRRGGRRGGRTGAAP